MRITTNKVRVTKDDLVFSAGHFITYNGGDCERIHGHNYRVAVEVEGNLNTDHYVFDFVALLALTQSLVAELDHRMLLPGRSDLIRLEPDGPNWLVRYRERRWSFPQEECAVLPIANTTAELLAHHLGERLMADFQARNLAMPRVLRVEVEENFGQTATAEWGEVD